MSGDLKRPKLVTDFGGLFKASSEKRVAFHLLNDVFTIEVELSDNKKMLVLKFDLCIGIYFSTLLGYSPFERQGSQLVANVVPGPGDLIEHFGTDLQLNSIDRARVNGTQISPRHFWIYFENTGYCIDILAQDFTHISV